MLVCFVACCTTPFTGARARLVFVEIAGVPHMHSALLDLAASTCSGTRLWRFEKTDAMGLVYVAVCCYDVFFTYLLGLSGILCSIVFWPVS